MPVRKFKTFEEAEDELCSFHPDSEWIKRAFRIFRLSRFGEKTPIKKGIKKFKTLEEAQEEK